MAKLPLKYVVVDVDRHGKVRRYFRRKGKPKIPLPGQPGSVEFMSAYQQALEGKLEGQRRPLRMPAGSFRELVEEFYRSSTFKRLDTRSQRVRMRILERFLSGGVDALPYRSFGPARPTTYSRPCGICFASRANTGTYSQMLIRLSASKKWSTERLHFTRGP
jgi:hypothetical protein